MRTARLRVALRLEGRNSQRDAIENQLATPGGIAFRNIGRPKWIANTEKRGPTEDHRRIASYIHSSTDRQIFDVYEFDIRTIKVGERGNGGNPGPTSRHTLITGELLLVRARLFRAYRRRGKLAAIINFYPPC